LFVVPDTVIKSRTAKLFNVVLVAEILYSLPVAVKLISVPVTFALCDFDANTVVLVCAICCYLFVSNKIKGDGYYSQPDGVHTVAHKVSATLTGAIKMQGSLATTPSEDDWFDISGTTFTTDQSTTISSSNFTGNFVWVRAKATSVTAGTITSTQLNH